MSIFLDTSVIVRYLTGDPSHLLERARQIVDDTDPVILTDLVLAETAYVLRSGYGVPRQVVVDTLTEFLRKRNVKVHNLDKNTVIQSLKLCGPSGRISFTDALLWAIARCAAEKEAECIVYSFDKRFPSEGIELRCAEVL